MGKVFENYNTKKKFITKTFKNMSKEKKFITCDGNEAAAHISYMFSGSCYLSYHRHTMAEHVDEWAAQGRKNIFRNRIGTSAIGSRYSWALCGACDIARFAPDDSICTNIRRTIAVRFPCIGAYVSHSRCVFLATIGT